MPAAERDIVKLLLEGQHDIVDFIFKNVTVDQFTEQRARKLTEFLQSNWRELGEIDAVAILNEMEDQELKGMITDISLSRYELSKGWVDKEIDEPDSWQIAKDAITLLRKRAIQKQIEENQRMLKEAAQRGSDKMPFVVRHQELMNLMKEMESSEVSKSS